MMVVHHKYLQSSASLGKKVFSTTFLGALSYNTPDTLGTECAFFDCSKGTECALCAQSVKDIRSRTSSLHMTTSITLKSWN